MIGKKEYVERITPAEALQIFEHATSEDMCIAKGLYDAYREARQKEQSKRNIA